ncbi:MAG: hypothetical protein ABR977_09160 [Candidatus Dormibacteria bacterium]|jgi:hypothetical protein
MIPLPAREHPPARGRSAAAGDGDVATEVGAGAAPHWRVHIPTVDESCVRLRCRQPAGAGPWPLSVALTELGPLGLRVTERFRSLGRGRGQPLVHTQEASWCGLAVHLESLVSSGGTVVEAALALPGMDEVVLRVDEDSWWELVDVFATAVDASHGALVDGEPVDLSPPESPRGWRRRVGDHLALLVPSGTDVGWSPAGSLYTSLPSSRLEVVLR